MFLLSRKSMQDINVDGSILFREYISRKNETIDSLN